MQPSATGSDKTEWRARLLAARRAVPMAVRAGEALRLTEAAVAAAVGAVGPVCCYLPVGSEPGTAGMVDALLAAGHDVLLPIVPVDRAGAPISGRPMSWASYRGPDTLVDGPFGLRQPSGPGRGPAALAAAGLVLVPALAVDRGGVRLGRGAGWYDRTLPLARPGTPLLAVVRDDELVSALPVQPHDVPMTGVLTPGGGLRALPLTLD